MEQLHQLRCLHRLYCRTSISTSTPSNVTHVTEDEDETAKYSPPVMNALRRGNLARPKRFCSGTVSILIWHNMKRAIEPQFPNKERRRKNYLIIRANWRFGRGRLLLLPLFHSRMATVFISEVKVLFYNQFVNWAVKRNGRTKPFRYLSNSHNLSS